MMLCKDCRHWGFGKCTLIYWSDLDEEEVYDGAVIYVNYKNPQTHLNAVLNTGPDFGCAHGSKNVQRMMCKDCRYWRDGECVDIDLDTFDDVESKGSNRELCYIVENEDGGLECVLKTGPEFGCVRFRKK